MVHNLYIHNVHSSLQYTPLVSLSIRTSDLSDFIALCMEMIYFPSSLDYIRLHILYMHCNKIKSKWNTVWRKRIQLSVGQSRNIHPLATLLGTPKINECYNIS